MDLLKKRRISAFLIIGLLLVFLYGKNLLERQSFRAVSGTLSTVYKDRLLVESYIFQISEKLSKIQTTHKKQGLSFFPH
ncbi:hypothetical protein FGO68_gene14553 [Halteria grandinella]|uniref:Uncharacterized protein n=1 Tax=Halteria grandinella TaxID=5974 RepID=A0A8J8N9P4_HALGN|nr:hypothetical protein FGO68_gene14553 [Halteria grandinella]